MARSLLRFLAGVTLLALPLTAQVPGTATLSLTAARERAAAVLPTILGAAGPAALAGKPAEAERHSLGANLADYANNPGADPAQFESFVEAARRILAGGTTLKRAPDATSHWLNESANAILASVRAAETAAAPPHDATHQASLTELRVRALLARFHARRALAAVHYNLFKRGLRLAELIAATYGEKDAVAVWRELVTANATHPLAPQWRAELKKLELNLKELEEQCCPPDEAILKEKVWQPTPPPPPSPR